jgi:hypothetical protein
MSPGVQEFRSSGAQEFQEFKEPECKTRNSAAIDVKK